MKQFYYTYKITLLKGSLAGHYYYGQHITDNINDGYAGSGRIIRDYYKKYGKVKNETYIKTILSFYKNQEELNNAEYELIGNKFETDKMCLNLRAGGNQCGRSEESKKICSEKLKGKKRTPETLEKMRNVNLGNRYALGHRLNDEQKKKLSDVHKGQVPWNKGLKNIYSEETKEKIGNKFKGRHWKIDPVSKKRVWYDE